ncbi:MAG: hypothetical protein DLM52_07515 [Chthoniobacterales bacterium]|nr:MAG: hypothetical protein DLM52_07515 [Chthoniobacterales bacterium]
MIELNENHRRSISITLQQVDKTLCEWSDWAEGRVRRGVMYVERDTLSAGQKEKLKFRIAKVRQLMCHLRDDLRLQAATVDTSQALAGPASILWEMLAELNSRSLRAYGNVPDELASYLDGRGVQLAESMNDIARLFSRPVVDQPYFRAK